MLSCIFDTGSGHRYPVALADYHVGTSMAGRAVRAVIPERIRPSIRSLVARWSVWPPVGQVRFGSLRRTEPIAPIWPPRFGEPVDRVYIDRFFETEAASIRGDVLEVGGLRYTDRFGQEVSSRSVLHSPIGAGPNVTYASDLVDAPEIPSGHFDAVVLPQTLLFIYDVQAAVRTLHRILRPGGVVLATVPGITQTVPEDKDLWGQYWAFTDQSVARLFGDVFGPDQVTVRSHGNVKTTIALLHGLAIDDLSPNDFDIDDSHFPLILTVKATRRP